MILSFLGTKGTGPTYNQDSKKFTQCRLVNGKNNLTIDAGNSFKHPTDLVLISQLKNNFINKFHTVPQGVLVWASHKSFIPALRKKNPRVKLNYISPEKTTKFKKFLITPFRVQKDNQAYGFRIQSDNKKIVWLPSFENLFGTSKFLKNLDYLFINALTLNKNTINNQSISNTLSWLDAQDIRPKKIYTINHGRNLFPIKNKKDYLKKSFPNHIIDCPIDGRVIKL